MRPRNRLQVNTFPFLAVLLCAMGALILILLVMDRRARLAALERGQDEAGRLVQERAEAVAARERENSGKHEEIKVAYDRKKAQHKARLDAEQHALSADMRQVQGRLAAIAGELRAEEALAGKLRADLRAEQARLASQEQALAAARKEAADLGGKVSASERARHKLAADAVQLGQIVRDLGETRKRDAMTYSVVPYGGKHGEKRAPIYVECNATGLLFHPDKLTLTEPTAAMVQAEVSRRADRLAERRKKAGLKEERAYLLMLVRPDGINRYYQMQTAIQGLPVEFGYEFVDKDWALTIPEGVELAETPKAAPAAPTPTVDTSARVSRPQSAGEGPDLEIGPTEPVSTLTPPANLPLLRLPGSIAAATPTPDAAPAQPRAFPLAVARVGGPAQTVVFVECRSDGVVVYPSGKAFSIDSLNHSPAHNPLYHAVVAMLAKHPGDPKLRAVRFLVHPDGERTFAVAAPAFNGVSATKTRYGLKAGDDVSRIVAGE